MAHRDVIIVGAGPAGLAAAIALRRHKIGCLAIDALQPSIDKGCGEGLMPDALASLAQLGVTMTSQDGHPFHGIRFANRLHSVNARFPAGLGMGVRRTRLHEKLVERALAAGVELRWGGRVRLPGRHAIDRPAIEVDGKEVSYQYLIGADGQASTFRKWAGMERARKERLRFGFRRHYQIAPWSDFVEVHWSRIGQLYVTPVAHDCVCVAFVTRHAGAGRGDFLEAFPEVAERLGCAALCSRERGASTATRSLRHVVRSQFALVGDASGSVDAITGEGLALSFRQAVALAEAIEQGRLIRYQESHRKLFRLPNAMAELMLRMDRWPQLERRAMAAFATHPPFFERLLSVHVGVASLSQFAMRHGAGLGWQLLQANIGSPAVET